ncbi:MAG: ABC transporter substrate-binding protein [Spirochaetota bacterium]
MKTLRIAAAALALLLVAGVAFATGTQETAEPEGAATTAPAPGDETAGITDDEILVGSFQALSGSVAAIGVPVKNGMEAYFNFVNAQGGVNGRQVNLLVADDAFDPSRTTVEVKRLVESDNVFALVGGLGTPGNLAIMDYVEEQQVPYVYQASGSGLLTNPPKEYIFGVQPNYTTEGTLMAKYLVEEKGAENIAVVYRNLDDGQELAESVRESLAEYGQELVADIAIDPSAQDFSANLVQLNQAQPDAIIVGLFVPQSANFIKQAKELGLTDQNYLLTYSNADATFVTLAEGQAEGAEAMAWVDVDFTETEQMLFQIYDASFPGEIPNAYAVAGMIAAEVFTEGLERAGRDLTRSSYVEALETLDLFTGAIAEGITYTDFDASDPLSRIGKRSMYVLKVEDGVFARANDWIYLTE